MNLFERLTPVDRGLIQDYIETYGDHGNQAKMHAPLSQVLDEWSRSKEFLYKTFGEKFIVEKQVRFEKPSHVLNNDIWEAVYQHCANPMFIFRDALRQICYYNNKDEFNLTDTEKDAFYWLFEECFNAVNLASNRYPRVGREYPLIGRVCEGQKITSILKKVASAFNLLPEYEQFRLEHSRLLNDKMLSGTLCLSIHPMDYLTMSDNDCGWDSCMSWQNDGCYHSGTVEMMNSSSVVVAYLKASNDMKVPGGTWNSKKWRMLYICEPECGVVGIKEYPYYSEPLVEGSMDMFKEILTSCGIDISNWFDYSIDCEDYCDNHGFELPNGDICHFQFDTNRMYNDFGCAPVHPAFLNPDKVHWFNEYNYSGDMTCICCGTSGYIDSDESHCICDDCDNNGCHYCVECGERIGRGYEIHNQYGECFCEECYYNIYTRESIYNDEVLKDDCVRIAVIPTDDFFDRLKASDSCIRADRLYSELRTNWFRSEDAEDPNVWDRYFKHPYRTITLFNGVEFKYVLQSDITTIGINKGLGYYGGERDFKSVAQWILNNI